MVRTYIRGIQGPVDAKHLKIATDSKHFAVHTGPESTNNARRINRLGFDAVVSQRAIYEHFLPPFRAAAKAGTSSFMCSYNAIVRHVCPYLHPPASFCHKCTHCGGSLPVPKQTISLSV